MQRFTGKEYLYIDIANHYGLDKKLWNQRIEWVKARLDKLENYVAEAEEPAEYYAAVLALREAQKGNKISYPIALDATSSGIQIISLLTHDRNAAKHCNVIGSTERGDIYTYIYQKMLDELGEEAKIQRADVKKAIMTSSYGSKATPKKVFGEDTPLLHAFYKVCNKEMPKVMEFMQMCLDLWNPKATQYTWIMPDGFTVHTKVKGAVAERFNWLNEPMDLIRYVEKPEKEGRSIGANSIHSIDSLMVREITTRCMINKDKIEYIKNILKNYSGLEKEYNPMVDKLWKLYKQSSFLSARIYDYITKDNLYLIDDREAMIKDLNTFPTKTFNVITIHDSYKCLPKYGNDIREQYIIQMIKIHNSNMLKFIFDQITGRNLKFNIKDNFTQEILNSEYALS